MRHTTSFSQLAGTTVGILGVGVEGTAARDRLVALGCSVILVDDAPTGDDQNVLQTAAGGLDALLACDAVVKTPGISKYRADIEELERAGVPVLGGTAMWLEEADLDRVICVTGTKGKSTVTTVIAHLASGLGTPAIAVGNLGVPPFDPAVATDGTLVVVETSSFQAADVAHSPGVVVVTSLGEDHVDWHGSVERYWADKLSLSSQPGARHTVAADTALLRAHAALLGGEVTWVRSDPALAVALGLEGDHGASNAAVAAAALRAARVEGSDDAAAVLAAAAGYEPLDGRFRTIDTHRGVRFIDDSLATNPLPTIAAIRSVGDARLAVIIGGHDRGVDYHELARVIASRKGDTLVVTLPDNGPAIGALVAARGAVSVVDAVDVDDAVRRGAAWADGDGVVLLSPAAPSFSQFRNWKERSVAFAAAVARVSA